MQGGGVKWLVEGVRWQVEGVKWKLEDVKRLAIQGSLYK